MSTALTTSDYNDRQMTIIREQIAKGASDDELAYFLEVCRLTGLNPLQKQIYAIKRWSGGREQMTIQTGIDGYRVMAARTGALAGIDDAVYDSEGGEHPGRASVTVWRFIQGHRIAFTATARWGEYVQTNKDGTPSAMWKKMPWLMLGKCAEALALRKAFPAELSGIYTAEEMSQADSEPFRPEPTDPEPASKRATKRTLAIVEANVEANAEAERVSQAADEAIAALPEHHHWNAMKLSLASRALTRELGWSDEDSTKAFFTVVNGGKPIDGTAVTHKQRLIWYEHLLAQKTEAERLAAENADLSTLDPQDVKVS